MKNIALFFILLPLSVCAKTITVGSKAFTESYVLAEIAKVLLEKAGFTMEHKQGMGNTAIVWQALTSGAIDMYPDYTGTISRELLKKKELTHDQLAVELRKLGIGITGDLGFDNRYALTMKRSMAAALGIKNISDLRNHPDLRVGITHEFQTREDGWPLILSAYGLNMSNVRGIQHTLAYVAMQKDEIDITDAYSTDSDIAKYDLVTLDDDRNVLPRYRAVFLYRLDIDPKAIIALQPLVGTIDEKRMIGLNAEADKTKNYALAASKYFDKATQEQAIAHTESSMTYILRLTGQHLIIVGISMAAAILVGVLLGIAASSGGFVGSGIMSLTGVLQTIPSLALLAILVAVPGLGVGKQTAIVALFLYGLLPIVRNTATGLQDIPTPIRESAEALGLSRLAILTKVYLPMASRTILAGIKTSAIINVGTATIAALIGAGGLGEPIISGLAVNDPGKILQGAIPAAVLALLVQFFFDLLDRAFIPRGLRLKPATE